MLYWNDDFSIFNDYLENSRPIDRQDGNNILYKRFNFFFERCCYLLKIEEGVMRMVSVKKLMNILFIKIDNEIFIRLFSRIFNKKCGHVKHKIEQLFKLKINYFLKF